MMNGYNIHEKESILKAKLNEVTSNTGKSESELIDMNQSEFDDFLSRTYLKSDKIDKCSYLIDFLRKTKDPKYIELGRILEIINKNNVGKRMEAKDLATLVVNNSDIYGSISNVKTTYKEFQKIQKRRKKISKKTQQQLKRYGDVEVFYRTGVLKLWSDIINKFGKDCNLKYDSSIQKEVIQFLNSHHTLDLLYHNDQFKKTR